MNINIGLIAPVLLENYTENNNNGTYDVTVWWTKGNCAPDNIEYNLRLTITDKSSQKVVNYITKETQMTLLHIIRGIEYTVTVTAQLCNGNLMSNTSNKLSLNIIGKNHYWPISTPCMQAWKSK